MRQKTFDEKNWCSPLIQKLFSLTEIFWNAAQKGSPTKFFGTVRQNNFGRKSCFTNFSIPEISETLKGSFTKFFSTVRQKTFGKIRDTSSLPPSLPTRNVVKQRRVPRSPAKFFGTVGQEILYRKSWYSPFRQKVFRYPKFLETQTVSSTKFFGTVRRKFFNGK